MDSMFESRQVEPVYVTSAPIPDYTENRGAAGYGARDMLISALSEMTKQSAAIRFVAFDRSTPDVVALQNSHPQKADLRVPDFFIRGAVTQINTSPYSKQRGTSLSIGEVSEDISGGGATTSGSVSLATVSIDLAMGLISNYQLLPGVFSANTFTVGKTGVSDELSISLSKVGGVYRASENESKALSEGLRALIEVGAIELFGKLYGVPYWECLAVIGEERPEVYAAHTRYDQWDRQKIDQYVFNYLQKQGYAKRSAQAYEPGLPDSLTLEFRAAILQVRSELNLFGNPGVDKPLFTEIWIMDNIEEADPSTRGGAIPLSPARNQPATDSAPAGSSSTGSGPDSSSSSKSEESAASVAAGAPAPGSPMRQTPPQRQNNPDIQPGSQ
ncbi:MAG: hypothetical protein HOH17_07890 [Halieaceae bacterium]|jgi:hypothetical protein|nr:hypothetical protein [Halieaceae bacterium]